MEGGRRKGRKKERSTNHTIKRYFSKKMTAKCTQYSLPSAILSHLSHLTVTFS